MDKCGVGALAVLVSAAVVLSGCGVPNDGPAVEIAIEQNDGSGSSGEDQQQLGPDTDAETSVLNFLQAAAGISTTRGDRLNQFYATPSSEQPELATQVVNIIDVGELIPLSSGEDGEVVYRLRAEIVGIYDQFGEVSPPDGKRDFTMDFRLSQTQPDGKWRLVDQPPRLLLTDAAFASAYEVSPLYFQRKDANSLVPDIRYIYENASLDRKRADLVGWLLQGPSKWLEPAVTSAFPAATELNKQPTADGGDLVIDLGSDAVTGDENKMAAQLAWTLWKAAGGLSLRLERNGQPVFSSTINAYLDANPTAAVSTDPAPAMHYFGKGVITPNEPLYGAVDNGKYAAASVSRRLLAVVDSADHLTVYVTSETKLAERVVTDYPVRGLPAGALGRPTWVSEQTLLLPVGGKLIAVNERKDGSWKAQPESLLSGVGRISAAPDGGRLALTVDGRAYVAPVILQGDGTVELGDRKAVDRGYRNVKDVGWSEEHRLVLLNSGPKDFLRSVSIDDLDAGQLKDDGPSFPPESLAVACDSPVDGRSISTKVYVDVNGKLYQSESTGLRPLENLDGSPASGTAPFFYASPRS